MDLFRRLTGGFARPLLLSGTAFMGLCVVACSHVDPYETPWQDPPGRNDIRRILPPSPIAAPDYANTRYVSAMHEQLERVDEHRVRLQAIIRKIGSERDLYDTALWLTVPLLAFSPAPKDVTKGAAVLGAGYAYLNSRSKEQVPILEDAIARLTCLMVDYSPYLYTNRDFGALNAKGQHSERYDELLAAIRDFEESTGKFIASVPVRASKMTDISCALHGTADCTELQKRLARIETAGNGAQIVRYRDYAQAQIERAYKEAESLVALEDEILRDAPTRVMLGAHRIMEETGRREQAAQAPLIAPGVVLNGKTTTQAGSSGAIEAQSRERTRSDTGLPPLSGPTRDSRTLRAQADASARRLADARRAAQAFTASHARRLAASASTAQRFCTQYTLVVSPATRDDGRPRAYEEPLPR